MLHVALSFLALSAAAPQVPDGLDLEALRLLPVQHNGRYPPLDTLAREVVSAITGRERFDGHDPVALVLAWQFSQRGGETDWSDVPLIKVEHAPLKHHIALTESRRRFSLRELQQAKPLLVLVTTAHRKQREGTDPTALERQATEVYNRMGELQAMLEGRALPLVPPASSGADHQHAHTHWAHPSDRTVADPSISQAWAALGTAFLAEDAGAFAAATETLASALAARADASFPSPDLLARELRYNRLRPFRWAWVFMVATMVTGLVGLAARRRLVDALALVLLAAGFGLHTYGIVLRWQIAGRAPFANMYESLILMAWGIELFALVFFLLKRMQLTVVLAGALGGAGLILADLLPLDATIGPIPPVLRNTVWLTIHVVTIMLAYGALALAMGIGHVQLGVLSFAPHRKEAANAVASLIHGVVLVGVLFLTAGIIFGSIWANASWGRYWGWDPKETWSLITLFGYLGMLHARYVGWLRQFGIAVVSILAFMLVVMTYYGVNYVLGAGLHSYGFGAGGLQWVLLYMGAEALILMAAAVRHYTLALHAGGAAISRFASPAARRH